MKRELSGYVALIMHSIEMKENSESDLSEQMESYIRDNCYKKITIQDISEKFYVAPTVCSHILKEKLGKSFNEYLSEIRIEKAKELLKDTSLSIEVFQKKLDMQIQSTFSKYLKK